MSAFTADLEFGHKYEDIFISHCLKNPVGLDRPVGKFSGYDFAVNGIRYEVKADRQTYKTGNFCIETACNGKPSGLSMTQATHYVYFVVFPSGFYDIYVIPTATLTAMIVDKKYNREMRGGDGGRSQFFLFDKELFNEYKVDGKSPDAMDTTEGIVCGFEALEEHHPF